MKHPQKEALRVNVWKPHGVTSIWKKSWKFWCVCPVIKGFSLRKSKCCNLYLCSEFTITFSSECSFIYVIHFFMLFDCANTATGFPDCISKVNPLTLSRSLLSIFLFFQFSIFHFTVHCALAACAQLVSTCRLFYLLF